MLGLCNIRTRTRTILSVFKPILLDYVGTSHTISTKQRKFRVALLQFLVGVDRMKNLSTAEKMIAEAKKGGADLVALPECFNSPYGIQFFKKFQESIPNGPSSEMLSNAAKKHKIYLVGGTIAEKGRSKCYNTCTVWDPEGKLIAKYRKMHLFAVDIPGKIKFVEAEVLSAGHNLVMFQLGGVKVGIAICYDIRFEELAKLYRLQGCELLIYPAAFNTTTGPIHFELLQRSRALDNQVFVLAISPAMGKKGYISWGHSQVTSPWGKVLAQAGAGEEILFCNLDFAECDEVREQLPIIKQRRSDLYNTVFLKGGKTKNNAFLV